MVSMTLTGSTELMDALDEVRRHRPGTVFWVNAAQQVFEALAAVAVIPPAPQVARYGDADRAIGETPRRYGRGSRGRLMMQQQVFWAALDRLAMSQNAVAQAAGISGGLLSIIAQRRRGAGPGTAAKLAEVTNVPMDELFVREVA